MSETPSLRPYVGLIPFHEKDAELFFGRDQERDIITSNLMASRLTLLYGASGVGKSSVLHAGVAYHVRALARRDLKRRGKPKFVIVVFSAWRDDPVRALLLQVQNAVSQTLGQSFAPLSSDLSFVDSLREWSKRSQAQLLIVLDQFEEYFLYHPQEEGKGTFAEEFPRAVNTLGLSVNFLTSYREDAHAKLDFFKGRIPNLYDNYLRIGHLSYDAAHAAIEQPILRYNELQKLHGDNQYSVEEDLITNVLSQVRAGEKYIGDVGKGVVEAAVAEKGRTGEVETPYLQLVMERLWDAEVASGSRILRLQTLNDLGGAKHIVQTHLDHAMGGLSRKEQDMGADSFKYLVTPSGTKIAQTAHDLAQYAHLSSRKEEQLEQMMKKLASGDSRVLRSVPPPNSQPNARRYEVFHDVLAQAILDWRRRYLARKLRRRWLVYVGAMAVGLVLMGGVTVFAVRQRNAAQVSTLIAQESESRARQFASEAARQRQIADTLAKDANIQRQIAVSAESEAKNAAVKAASAALSEAHARSRVEIALHREAIATEQAQKNERDAKAAEAKANAAAQQANDALDIVDKLEASNPFSKIVFRPGKDLINITAAIDADAEKVITFGAVENQAQVWSVHNNRQPTQILSGLDVIDDVTFDPNDNNTVVVVSHHFRSTSSAVTLWDVSSKDPVKLDELSVDTINFDVPRFSNPIKMEDLGVNNGKTIKARFSSDGRSLVAFGLKGGKECGWHREKRKLDDNCTTFEYPTRVTQAIVNQLSPDGKLLIYSVNWSEFYIYDAVTKTELKLPLPREGSSLPFFILEVSVSPNNKYVAVSTLDNMTRVFDARTGTVVRQFVGDKGIESTLSFSPNSQYLVEGRSDGTARVWMISTGEVVANLIGHRTGITDAQFSADSNYVVTASGDQTARVWDLRNGTSLPLQGHYGQVDSAVFSSDRNYVLTVGGDETARVWDIHGSLGASTAVNTSAIENNEKFDFDQGVPIEGSRLPDISWSYSVRTVEPRDPRLIGLAESTTLLLIPEQKAQLATLSSSQESAGAGGPIRKFEDIAPAELLSLNYSSTPLGGTFYRPGSSQTNPLPAGFRFAVRTSEGNYTKVEIIESGPTLKIKWVTYKNQSRQARLNHWNLHDFLLTCFASPRALSNIEVCDGIDTTQPDIGDDKEW